MPVEEPTVATVVWLLTHIPPDVALLNVVVRPTHTTAVPVLVGGDWLTVTVVVT